jgi:hypothetical protein
VVILGLALVLFGLVLHIQSLWLIGAVLIAAGAALTLVGCGPRRSGRGMSLRCICRTAA